VHDPSLSQVIVTILTIDFLRYALTAGAVWLIVDAMLGRRLIGRRILDAGRKPGQVRREFAFSMLTVLIFAANGLLIFLLQKAGHTRIYADIGRYGWLYWVASLVLAIVLHDAYFYWSHRLLHRGWWFARVHHVHHQSVNPTPWAAYAFHPVEAAIHAAFFTLLVLIVPLHPAAITIFLLHMIVRNCIGHCGIELMPWRLATRGWLRWTTTITHHHFHHARNRGNFGLYFTWWDRICGTEDAEHRTHGNKRFGLASTTGATS
jgi:sterol desaturase/sphingolipid hydroxylase (fatty acid hydroxylase superfamily)